MRMMSDVPLYRFHSHTCNIDIPTINLMSLRRIDQQSGIISSPIHNLQLFESNALLISGCGGYARHHHEFYQFLRFCRKLLSLRVFESIFRRGDVLVCKRFKKLDSRSASLLYDTLRIRLTTCSLSCQNSCSLALSRKGKLRTW